MASLEELKVVLEEEGLMARKTDFESRYSSAVRNNRVRELLEIETPQITDLTDILEIGNGGRLCAVRTDLTPGVDNHKKHIVAGLILRGFLKERILRGGIDTLVDGGNVNSAKALKYHTKRLGLKGIYVMSRLFRQKPEIIDMLESDHFKVIIAPKVEGVSIETEFYSHVLKLMKDREFRRGKYCLWHANSGGKAAYPLGLEIAENLEEVPDHIVSCLGAGSTLEGLQIPIQDYFRAKGRAPSIVIAEHELSPLFAKFIRYRPSSGSVPCVERTVKDVDPDFYEKVEGVPHIAIGPHYQEINPLISENSIARIDEVVQYSEYDWMSMQKYLKQRGINVGNSSAANLNVAANLANEGNNVLTVIFEPFREFYKRRESFLRDPIEWLFAWRTPAQKAGLVAAAALYLAAITYCFFNPPPDNAPDYGGMSFSKSTIEASKEFFNSN